MHKRNVDKKLTCLGTSGNKQKVVEHVPIWFMTQSMLVKKLMILTGARCKQSLWIFLFLSCYYLILCIRHFLHLTSFPVFYILSLLLCDSCVVVSHFECLRFSSLSERTKSSLLVDFIFLPPNLMPSLVHQQIVSIFNLRKFPQSIHWMCLSLIRPDILETKSTNH